MKKTLFLSIICICTITASYCQITGSFVVKGLISNYYPVTFYDGGWSQNVATEIQIGRSSVHVDGSWRGSLISKFRYHTTNNGNGSTFIEANLNQNRTGIAPVISDFIGGWKDATATNSDYRIIIWLRGGTTTYYYNANATVTPTVYDGVTNSLPYQETSGPQDNLLTTPYSYVNKQGVNLNSIYAGSTDINYFGGNIGITTTTPGAKLSFGTNVGSAAIHLYDASPGYRYGMGIQSSEMQMFIAPNSHFSWNGGGDLQTSGSKELMRLNASGNLAIQGKVSISPSDTAGPTMDIDPKTNWEASSLVRLIGATVDPLNYSLTIKKADSKAGGSDHPTFSYNFDRAQFGGLYGTQLSLAYDGSVGIGGGLTIQDAYTKNLIGGSIKPGINGLDTYGGNIHTITAGTAVRINAPLLQAKKVKVTITAGDWADYVFASGYSLTPLNSVENFINKYKHLPDVPSAQEVEKNDLDIGATQALLLKKIEELTLYMIQQDKTITSQQEMLETLKKEIQNKANKSIN